MWLLVRRGACTDVRSFGGRGRAEPYAEESLCRRGLSFPRGHESRTPDTTGASPRRVTSPPGSWTNPGQDPWIPFQVRCDGTGGPGHRCAGVGSAGPEAGLSDPRPSQLMRRAGEDSERGGLAARELGVWQLGTKDQSRIRPASPGDVERRGVSGVFPAGSVPREAMWSKRVCLNCDDSTRRLSCSATVGFHRVSASDGRASGWGGRYSLFERGLRGEEMIIVALARLFSLDEANEKGQDGRLRWRSHLTSLSKGPPRRGGDGAR